LVGDNGLLLRSERASNLKSEADEETQQHYADERSEGTGGFADKERGEKKAKGQSKSSCGGRGLRITPTHITMIGHAA
jgi:hypothetical protein